MRTIATLLLVAGGGLALAGPAAAMEFTADKAHSSVEFKVTHLAISKVRGEFKDFDAGFTFEPGRPELWSVEATIDAASIDTGNERRDDHLRSADFLDVEQYPTITFRSTGVEMDEDGSRGRLMGDLTIRGVTRPVTMDLEFAGMVDFMGTTKAGFEASTTIDRKDYGLTWNKALETGGLVVGDEVEISIHIEGDLVAPDEDS